ncbi:MAG TPA: hypothetical protein VG797_09935 [Phycisphaerales bacterium]|nr:hypothetical protein [Phycisphaerales bacterium]
MAMRLGEILVTRGVLTEEQVDMILREQMKRHRPFGLLAEQLCNVPASTVESAWAEQYSRLTEHVDARSEKRDPEAMKLVSARQAWQFRLMPLRFGETGELVIVTTSEHLRRAFRFVSRVLERPALVLLTPPMALGEALVEHFPIAGLTAESIRGHVPGVL